MVNQAERINIRGANSDVLIDSLINAKGTSRDIKNSLKDMKADHARVLTKINLIIGLQVAILIYLVFQNFLLKLFGI